MIWAKSELFIRIRTAIETLFVSIYVIKYWIIAIYCHLFLLSQKILWFSVNLWKINESNDEISCVRFNCKFETSRVKQNYSEIRVLKTQRFLENLGFELKRKHKSSNRWFNWTDIDRWLNGHSIWLQSSGQS